MLYQIYTTKVPLNLDQNTTYIQIDAHSDNPLINNAALGPDSTSWIIDPAPLSKVAFPIPIYPESLL